MLRTNEVKVVPGGNISKVIEPGLRTCKILKVELEKTAWDKNAYHIRLHLETKPIGDGFEGFLIDKTRPQMGSYDGQVAKIRFSQYPYKTNTTSTGIKIERDPSMLKALLSLCIELGCEKWFRAQDNQHETIEEIFHQFNIDRPYADKWMNFVLASQEYYNTQGYKNNDLFLPKPANGKVAFELENSEPSRLLSFDANIHIIPPKDAKNMNNEDNRQKETLDETPFGSDDWDDDDDI